MSGPAVCARPRELRRLGQTVEHVRLHHPELWERNERQRDEDFRWPGGESYREFRARCVAALERIATSYGGQRVAVVTHADVATQIVGTIHGVSCARWELFRPGNASISLLERGGASRRVISFDVVPGCHPQRLECDPDAVRRARAARDAHQQRAIIAK